jgi:hypothetical protein
MSRIRQYSSLSPASPSGLLRAYFALQLAIAAVRWLPLHRILAWADSRRPRVSPCLATMDPRISERLLNVVARYTVGSATCLHRALALHALLGRDGFHSRLRIGVARREGALAAHAWVEWEGGSSAPSREGDFVAFTRIAP